MSALLDLPDRVSQLEQQLAQLQEQLAGQDLDTLQPNYLTVNADGTVGADFTGKINAQGLILPTASSPPATAQSRVQWNRQSDNSMVAWIDGLSFDSDLVVELDLVAQPPAGAFDSQVEMFANDAAGNEQVVLQLLQQGSGGGNSGLFAQAFGQAVTLIDDLGRSSFLQLGQGSATLRLLYGRVNTSALAIGETTVQIALPGPWQHNHFVFIGTATPASSAAAGNYVQGSGTIDLAHGGIQLVSASSQVWRCEFISLGN